MTLAFYYTEQGFVNLRVALATHQDFKAVATVVDGEYCCRGMTALDVDTDERMYRLGNCDKWAGFSGWRYIEEDLWMNQTHARIELLHQGTRAVVYPMGGDERCRCRRA